MSVAIEKVVSIIELLAPKELAFEWDNTGLLLRCGDNVSNVLIALDVTQQIVDEAVARDCDMILSHHPLVMEAMTCLNVQSYNDSVVMSLIKNDISVYCAHTSYDKAVGGINDILAKKLGLSNVEIISGDGEDLMRVGELAKSCSPSQFYELVSKAVGVEHLKVSDTQIDAISKVAVVGGSGGDLLQAAKNAGAQALITGEAKHHHHLVAKGSDILLIEAGHYETEKFFVEEIFSGLQERVNEVQLLLGLKMAEQGSTPYKII
ncbi:MAG: Nif3-like dinuclear metal center hexameric protein [Clostridia bacterium]|jgi:GTP cyclohydrolase I|nr:Nif3-like dinuclear metal center hexameric protein [Clostridia bacterium]MBT7121453.1 Nif3-like dinuclear metal center hexameric protein [Clostridia bacterium]